MKWLNGLKITPERLMDYTADEQITSGLSVPTGWTVSSFTGTRARGITEVDIFITRTGADIGESSAGSGNITGDPEICTLPAGWAPPRAINTVWGNGSTDGEATIVTSGEVNLRSISGSALIATGTNVRVTAMWISENDGVAPAEETGDIVSYAEANLFWVTGASGDGVTDDLIPIQATLDRAHAAGGGTVIIPAGRTYGVSTFLVVYDNTVISAYGATIKAIGNSGLLRNFLGSETFAVYGGHSHITVLGGTWDGNAYNGVDGSVTSETDVMNFVHGQDITVRDVTILNTSTAHALEFNSSDHCRAINCTFLGYADNSVGSVRQFSEAVQIDMSKSGSSSIGLFDNTPARNIRVQGCRFGASSRCGNFGRAVGSHTVTAGVTYDNIHISDCRIEGTIEAGIYGYGWRRAVIANNIITSTGDAGIHVTLPDPATTSISPHTLEITGNTVESAGDDSGIRVISYAAYKYPGVNIADNTIRSITGNGIHAEHCQAPTITGNRVETTSSTAIYAHYSDGSNIAANTVRAAGSNALNVSGSVGVNVTGNFVDTTSTNFGVFVGQGADGTTNSTQASVSGNLIIAAASAGIRLSTNATGCLVTANKVRKGSGTTANGITLAASATDAQLLGNDFTGNSWSAATAMSVSTAAPITGPGGMQALPGSNAVDTDLTSANALEAAMTPSGRYETCSRLRCGTESSPSSGWLYLCPVWLPKGFTVSNLSFTSGNTAATTPTNYWFTLHNNARVALARTADQTTAAWAANTTKTLAIAQATAGAASSYTTTYAGLHYLGFMVAATTPPSIIGEGRLITGGTTSPGLGATGSGGLTTPPTVTAGAFTAGSFAGSAILAYGYAA
ncbi:right-handed parallel beta-helix repeat-containing protein [Streptomyces sp. NPDC005813]|uniref:right-handed parallel beta-helix repeat-containing protein n=1 Tax=Streptomyces sp. NPDC005813 TaxID=3155592 RepID=UPI003401A794